MDSIYKALADGNRRQILTMLKEKDMTVGEIGERLKISGATLSHHLDILKRERLVVSQREGQFFRYSLNTSVVEEVMKAVINWLGRKP